MDLYGDWLFPAVFLLFTIIQDNRYGVMDLGIVTLFFLYISLKSFRIAYDEKHLYLTNLFLNKGSPKDIKDIYRDRIIFHTKAGVASALGYRILHVEDAVVKDKIVMVSNRYRQELDYLQTQLV